MGRFLEYTDFPVYKFLHRSLSDTSNQANMYGSPSYLIYQNDYTRGTSIEDKELAGRAHRQAHHDDAVAQAQLEQYVSSWFV